MLNSLNPVKKGLGFFHLIQSGLKPKPAALRAEGKALVLQEFNWERDEVFSQWVLVKNPDEQLEVQWNTGRRASLVDTCKAGNGELPAVPSPQGRGNCCDKNYL